MTKPEPYPKYKDAGVPWLEDVPESWPVVSTRVALRPMKVLAGTDPSKHQLLSLTKQGVIPRDMENAQGKHPENYDTYQVVDIDDLIFCLFDIDETPRTVGLVKEPGMLTGAYTRFKTTSAADPRFICWYFLALDNDKRLKPLYTGLRKVIQKTRFLSAPMPLPELKVQRAIADFLDRESAQIDELIGKQGRLIELLAEKRQAIITHAVTKGLDPTAPTKPSGIPWLGEIPDHWRASKIRYVADTIIGLTYAPEDVSDVGTLVLRSGNVQKGHLVHNDDLFVSKPIGPKLILEAGDIVMCARNGSAALVGKNALVTEEFVGTTFGAFMTVIRSDLNPWLQWIFASSLFSFQLGSFSTSTINQLTNATLNDFDVPMPPRDEIIELCEHLEEACAKIDRVQAMAEDTVALLRERRSALVSAAVTGKIDVRKEAGQI